ncbi:MAG: hypothetical protein R3C19_10380 [Planctomycetaceae bacterium]
MRFRSHISVFVFAILIGQSAVHANDRAISGTAIQPVPVGPADEYSDCFGFNGFSQYRMSPDLGGEGSAGHGFQHFSMPMHSYTTWYRPRAATLNECVRCAQDSFRPRGFGNLFARPCDGYRMEYTPYVLGGDRSKYGPAYIARQPDPRCRDCDHTADGGHHH